MHNGFLAVETHQQKPGVVRLFLAEHSPAPELPGGPQPEVRYVARFSDSEAALMHAHEHLKRRLVDPDARLYRVPVERAVAAVEAIGLRHHRVYIDPVLAEDESGAIAAETARLRRWAERKRRFFEAMGYIGIGLLLFNLFVLSFAWPPG